MTKPATIILDIDKAVEWLEKGAQPTDTVRAILSYKGVLYKKHLLGGVAKGAFTAEEAEAKFAAWMTEKTAKINNATKALEDGINKDKADRLAAETKVNEARAEAIAKRKAVEVEAKVQEAQAEKAAEEGEATDTTDEKAAE
jgi:small subunit ribosomal protein S16